MSLKNISTTSLEEKRQELQIQENIVDKGLSTFIEVGKALMVISENKLYKIAGHNSFEEYCKVRWHLSSKQAYKYIANTKNMSKVSPIGDTLPESLNLEQARALSKVPEQHRQQVFNDVVTSGEKITGKLIEEKANEYVATIKNTDIIVVGDTIKSSVGNQTFIVTKIEPSETDNSFNFKCNLESSKHVVIDFPDYDEFGNSIWHNNKKLIIIKKVSEENRDPELTKSVSVQLPDAESSQQPEVATSLSVGDVAVIKDRKCLKCHSAPFHGVITKVLNIPDLRYTLSCVQCQNILGNFKRSTFQTLSEYKAETELHQITIDEAVKEVELAEQEPTPVNQDIITAHIETPSKDITKLFFGTGEVAVGTSISPQKTGLLFFHNVPNNQLPTVENIAVAMCFADLESTELLLASLNNLRAEMLGIKA